MWRHWAVVLGFVAAPVAGEGKVAWPDLPKSGFTRRRAATIDDAKRGDALFSLNGNDKGALPIDIPQYVLWRDEQGVKHPMIMVQAERAPNGSEIVGLRGFDGGEIVATLPEVTLLGTKKPR